MDRQSKIKRIVLVFIIIVFCLLFFLLYLFVEYNQNNSINNFISFTTSEGETKNTVREVIEKYESQYILEDNNTIYVVFSKDLYDKVGNSNKLFFTNIVNELEPFFENTDFYLTDNAKNIKIYAKFDSDLEKHVMIINNVEDYFDNTSGEDFIGVESVNYAGETGILEADYKILRDLEDYGMNITKIEEELGEGTELENGYISYLDGKIKLKLLNENVIGNIVIDRSIDEKLFKNFDNYEVLEEIADEDPGYCFGSPEEEFLGYRTENVYYFIYDDEISMYGYSYTDNMSFEDLLSDYIEERNFETFIPILLGQMPLYDYCEYNMDTKTANIKYSLFGFEINIENNDPKGITLYNNYCFSEDSIKLVKNGLVTFNNYENTVEKAEIQRRVNR